MPIIGFDETLACLEVEAVGDDAYGAPHIPMPYRRVFGGQLLAQCIAIAATTTPGKNVKSIHAIFPREGDLEQPIVYRVGRPQDGRTFSGRSITGHQGDGEGEKAIVHAQVSLHVEEPGPAHSTSAPEVEGPETAPPVDLSMIPWETRAVGGVDLAARDVGPPEYAFWMRAPQLSGAPAVHQALLAHATDLTLIGTTLRPIADLGEADSPDRVHTAVTSHTVWFHAPLRIDQWLLLHQTSPHAGGARGFGLGRVFDRQGALLASYAQESMIRPVA